MRYVRYHPATGLLLAITLLVNASAFAGDFTVKAATITEMKAVFGQVESRTSRRARAFPVPSPRCG